MKESARLEDETSGKLILAGIDLFGEHGFKGTTTRMIAESANSNIGSIAYYFGNKRGLYLATARHIAKRLRQTFELDTSGDTHEHLKTLGREQARETLEQLVRRMVRLFVQEEEARRWLMLIMREQANPSEAFDILYKEAFEIAHVTITTLVAILMERDPADNRVILETHTLVGQIVFFLVGRTPLLRRLDSGDSFPPEIANMAEEVVVSHLAGLERR
ncbi:CerR family C-terminal domain-containing protein [Marinobacter nanhaiticus D15-8W]|uniref:CerR family C-terminal domain-containing protein n=1 Tax=Marinobacter nanhaiticus TaxID=1305740 RepID=UPI0002C91C7E|nr:CerR family C-terminal domain-containing protein [Marinobacter nanhaiticus]BES72342.1 CerR family C-terminal domain-containing protein [Marinobacter nanhaiticus D15-8W]